MHTVITEAAGLGACVEDASRQPVVGLDTETTGLDPFTSRVRLVQIATPERVWVVECPADRADNVRDMQTATIEGAGPFLTRASVEVEIGVNEAWLQ
jgi:ribonuclease D